jgi:hypothetical protein
MGTRYYTDTDHDEIMITASLREHKRRDDFLSFLSTKKRLSAAAFAQKLFSSQAIGSDEIGNALELIPMALECDLIDLATEIGDLVDAAQY